MGWGEVRRPRTDDAVVVPFTVWDAANNLANRVREWDDQRSTTNEQRMIVALSIYDTAIDRVNT